MNFIRKKIFLILSLLSLGPLLVLFQNCSNNHLNSNIADTTPLDILPSPPPPLKSENCAEIKLNSFHATLPSTTALIPSDLLLKTSLYDINYKSPANNTYFQLDVHSTIDHSVDRPLIIFLHGGDDGDQNTIANYPNFINYFVQKGFIFASVNYRSSLTDPNLKIKDQADDIAAAVKWLKLHASEYGAKSDDFVLIGFSAGAHLATLISSDETYLKQVGLSFDILRGTIAFDVPHYNEPLNLELIKDASLGVSPTRSVFLLPLFGNSEAEQLAASPIQYINLGQTLKPLLLFSAGIKDNVTQKVSLFATSSYKAELEKYHQLVQYYPLQNYDHTELMSKFNTLEGEPISTAVGHFLDRLYKPTSNSANKFIPSELAKKIFTEIDSSISPYITTNETPNKIVGSLVGIVTPNFTMLTSCGFAEESSKRIITDATQFSVGSISKAFTGFILAKTVLDGKVNLNDPVASYLPEPLKTTFLSHIQLSTITFKQLVTHTSRLPVMPNNILNSDLNNPAAGYTLDLLNTYFQKSVCAGAPNPTCRLVLPPEKYSYSNLGIALLGITLQNALNNPSLHPNYTNYNELLQQYLLYPAGLDGIYGESDLILNPKEYFETNSGILQFSNALDSITQFLSLGHNFGTISAPTNNTSYLANMGVLAPAGGLSVNGRSMISLLQQVTGVNPSQIISPELMNEATKILATPTDISNKNYSVSYATLLDELSDGTQVFKKDGITASGYKAYMAWSKTDRTGVFIIINSSSEAFSTIETSLTEKLLLLAK